MSDGRPVRASARRSPITRRPSRTSWSGRRATGSAASEVVVAGRSSRSSRPTRSRLRLRPAVAAAALRTPDVEASPRGRGWVRFAPPELDDFARDRAIAWLESAVRLVAEGDPGTDLAGQPPSRGRRHGAPPRRAAAARLATRPRQVSRSTAYAASQCSTM